MAEFFTVVGAWTVRDFAVLVVIGSGDQVVAEIRAVDVVTAGRTPRPRLAGKPARVGVSG